VVVGDPLCAPFQRNLLSRADIDAASTRTRPPAFFAKRRVAQAMTENPGAAERVVKLVVPSRDSDQQGGPCRRSQDAGTSSRAGADSCCGPTAARRAVRCWLARLRSPQTSTGRIIAIDANNAVALNNLAYDLATRERKPSEALPARAEGPGSCSSRPDGPRTPWVDRIPERQHRGGGQAAGSGGQRGAGEPRGQAP
jgi:hypothetical protein